MKNILSILFLFFGLLHANGQDTAMNLLAHVIKTKSLKDYQNVIVAEMDTAVLGYTLKNIKSSKNVFKSIDTSSTKIRLTSKEKKYMLRAFKEQNNIPWTNEDFANLKVIKQEAVREYAQENTQNGYIYISAPVFIRDNAVAIVFFANFYGTVETGGGINNLSFYKLKNGKWENWITLEAGIYN